MNNSKKIGSNLILGILSQIVTIVLGVLIPRFVLTSYGSEINGLISSITQIYTYIGLLEAGVGTVTVQALYKTIAINDKKATNAVLSATNKYYNRTGVLYLLSIIAFSVIYPFVIRTEIPKVTIVLIIIFNGLGSVISFLFQGKYFLLLQAEGKNYIQTSVMIFTNIFKNIAKILLMHYGFDVVFVQAIATVVSLIQMLYIHIYIKRYYKWINLKEKPDFDAISQSKNVMVHQIGGLIFNSTDMIVLSFFCNLKVVSIYSMYTMLFGMISTALSTVSNSIIFSIGQTFHINKERFNKMFEAFELYYMTLVFALYSIANFFILPFIKLYTNGINDIQYIDKFLPLLFIATYLLSCGRSACNQVINFAGHFKKTQNRAILESVINIVISLIAVNFLGIYGVLLGTIAALLYRSNDIIIYSRKKILNNSVWKTYKKWIVNLLIFVAILSCNQFINIELNSYKSMIIFCIPYAIFTLIIFFTISSMFEIKTARFVFGFIKNKLKSFHNKK